MTAAPALASGPLGPQTSVRSSDSRRSDQNDTSFRDTLEQASRSSDTAPGDRPSRPSGKGNQSEDGSRDSDERDSASRTQDGTAQKTDQATAAELSLIIAALGGGSSQGSEDTETSAVPAEMISAAAGGGEAVDQTEAGPWFPGQVGEGGEELDAGQLLALLKSSATSGSEPANDPARVDIKVTVAGQETHLAVGGTETEALNTMPVAPEVAETPTDGEGEVSLNAALSKAANGATEQTVRPRGETATGDVKPDADAGAVRRFAPPAPEGGARGSSFADQGIAGQDGGQKDGRGSSGSNSQQQGTGVFASMVNGAGTARAAETANTPESYEPLSDQIAREVRAEMRADGIGETSTDGVVKVLHIELKPANLGSVTVRLALKDNAISVHMETQRRDTLAVIERERDALVSALSQAGYTVDGVTAASQSDASRSSSSVPGFGDSGSSAAQGGLQGQAGQGQGLGNSSGGDGRSGQSSAGNDPYRHSSDGKDDSGNSIRKGAEGLYV